MWEDGYGWIWKLILHGRFSKSWAPTVRFCARELFVFLNGVCCETCIVCLCACKIDQNLVGYIIEKLYIERDDRETQQQQQQQEQQEQQKKIKQPQPQPQPAQHLWSLSHLHVMQSLAIRGSHFGGSNFYGNAPYRWIQRSLYWFVRAMKIFDTFQHCTTKNWLLIQTEYLFCLQEIHVCRWKNVKRICFLSFSHSGWKQNLLRLKTAQTLGAWGEWAPQGSWTPAWKNCCALQNLKFRWNQTNRECIMNVMTDWKKQEATGMKGCFTHPSVVEEIDGCKSGCLDEKLRLCTISLSEDIISFLYLATFLVAWGHNSAWVARDDQRDKKWLLMTSTGDYLR